MQISHVLRAFRTALISVIVNVRLCLAERTPVAILQGFWEWPFSSLRGLQIREKYTRGSCFGGAFPLFADSRDRGNTRYRRRNTFWPVLMRLLGRAARGGRRGLPENFRCRA